MENQAGPAAKQTKGIKKLWFRIKASMKTEQANATKSSTASKTSKPAAPTSSPAAAIQPTPAPAPKEVSETNTATAQPSAQPELKKDAEDTKPVSQPIVALEVIQVDDGDEDTDEKFQMPQIRTASSDKEATAMRYQRAQEVFKKYNLDMEPADWQQTDDSSIPRVEKKPRMRVRYTCHECNQTFGREKKCSSCPHVRCDSCIRYPAKKTGSKARRSKKAEADPSTLVAPTTGACHECKTTFNLGATECETCNHPICSRCLQETVMASPATAPPPPQSISVAAAS